MNAAQQLFVLHAVTPLHIGIEDSLGGIDLPTMRERHTGYPLVPGSSVKGVLRAEAAQDIKNNELPALAAFGPNSELSGDYRGGLVITDAQLLALPIRSLAGTFAWVSCPHTLRRLERDLVVLEMQTKLSLPKLEGDHGAVPCLPGKPAEPDSELVVAEGAAKRVFLEEMLLTVAPSEPVRQLADCIARWAFPGDSEAQSFFRRRFLIIPDDLFAFLCRLALEVRARVKIDPERGTAADSGPWTEEHMPAETLLYGLAIGRQTAYVARAEGGGEAEKSATRPKPVQRTSEDNLAYLRKLCPERRMLRFGGHSSIGLGRAFFTLVPLAEKEGAK